VVLGRMHIQGIYRVKMFSFSLEPNNKVFPVVFDFVKFILHLKEKHSQQAVVYGNGINVYSVGKHENTPALVYRLGAAISISRVTLEKAINWSEIKGLKFTFYGVYVVDSCGYARAVNMLNLLRLWQIDYSRSSVG